MVSAYRWLLHLYPQAYRKEFAEEMEAVFFEAETATWQKSMPQRVMFFASEFAGVICGALDEHLRMLTGSGLLPLFGSRRLFMRSEFRFPKATVALMTIILAAVVWTIEKAKAISASVPPTGQQVGPISVQFTIVPTLMVALVITLTGGALAWVVLFALRRSGLQRFSDSGGANR